MRIRFLKLLRNILKTIKIWLKKTNIIERIALFPMTREQLKYIRETAINPEKAPHTYWFFRTAEDGWFSPITILRNWIRNIRECITSISQISRYSYARFTYIDYLEVLLLIPPSYAAFFIAFSILKLYEYIAWMIVISFSWPFNLSNEAAFIYVPYECRSIYGIIKHCIKGPD